MPKCWNCGAEVSEQAKFCPNCGKSFATSSSGMPEPSQPYNQIPQYPNRPGIDPSMQNAQLEKRVNTIQKMVIAIIILQALFLIFAFA